MRVLFAMTGAREPFGGIPIYVNTLIKGLQNVDQSIDIRVVALGDSPLRYFIYPFFVFPIMVTYTLRHIIFFFFLLIFQVRYRSYVIHCNDIISARSALSLKKLHKVLVVLTAHSYPTEEYIYNWGLFPNGSIESRFSYNFEKTVYESVDVLIAVDHKIRDYIRSLVKSDREIIVMKNFVEPPRILIPLKRADREYVILSPKKLVRSKGNEYLIKAVPKVVHEYPNCKFVILGHGPEFSRLLDLAKSLGVERHVVFTGTVPHSKMRIFYDMAEIVVVPSIKVGIVEEATSISLLEAMSLGKPVIATRIGGLKKILTDGVDGLLVPDRDESALANAILLLLKNRKMREKIGKAARKTVLEKYNFESRAKTMLKIYKEGGAKLL